MLLSAAPYTLFPLGFWFLEALSFHTLCAAHYLPFLLGFLTCFPYRIVCYYPMQIRPLKPCPWLPRRGDFQPIYTRPCRTLSFTILYHIFTTPFTIHTSCAVSLQGEEGRQLGAVYAIQDVGLSERF